MKLEYQPKTEQYKNRQKKVFAKGDIKKIDLQQIQVLIFIS